MAPGVARRSAGREHATLGHQFGFGLPDERAFV